ncbi:MAG: septum site-determining protein MinC [Legionellales bacterium]|nr:septum site-determining protein MinC [Legionellales bacterium]|tara:strand:- start:12849 stop:13592 length:744 start_codon:yes stop_codon:yes gene_type:complete
MEAVSQEKVSNAFKLKGSLFTLTIMQLFSADIDSFKQQLEQTVKQAPKFFQHAPIVLDLQHLPGDENIDFVQMCDSMRQHELIPVGVCGGTEAQQEAATEANLAVFPHNRSSQEDLPRQADDSNSNKPNKATESEESATNETLLVTKPIRSGQQVYAKGGDLIVVAPVSHGAELLADGNIHVYGVLRGRALAGIKGNTDARIFCKEFDAEMVSIAGLYQLSDDYSTHREQAHIQITLENDAIKISEL